MSDEKAIANLLSAFAEHSHNLSISRLIDSGKATAALDEALGLIAVEPDWTDDEKTAALVALISSRIDSVKPELPHYRWALKVALRLPPGPDLEPEFEQRAHAWNQMPTMKERFPAFRKTWGELGPGDIYKGNDARALGVVHRWWQNARNNLAHIVAHEIQSRNQRHAWQKVENSTSVASDPAVGQVEPGTVASTVVSEALSSSHIEGKQLPVVASEGLAYESDGACDGLDKPALEPELPDDEPGDDLPTHPVLAVLYAIVSFFMWIAFLIVVAPLVALVQRVVPPVRNWRFVRWVDGLTSEPELESLEDEPDDEQPIPISRRFVIVSTLVLLATVAATHIGLPFTWQPFKSWDEFLIRGGLIALLPFWLIGIILSYSDTFRKRVAPVFLVLILILFLVRAMNYLVDQMPSKAIDNLKHSGALLASYDFAHTGSCSAKVDSDGLALPNFSNCTSTNGSLDAEVDSTKGIRLGVYVPDGTAAQMSLRIDGQEPVYYVDTRVRADIGSISACGVEIESSQGGFLFRVLWDAEQEQYFGDISRVRFVSSPSRDISLVSLARSADLPFVNESTIVHPSYDTWTRLTVTVQPSTLGLIVDDRIALSVPYPGISHISSGAIAVVAGSSGSGGIASCSFDHEEVGIIPDGGNPN